MLARAFALKDGVVINDIREGDGLPDGTIVSDFSDGELDNQDDDLFTVKDPEGVHSLQYCPDGGQLQPLCKDFQELNGGVKLCGENPPDRSALR